jgi:putative heme transporter
MLAPEQTLTDFTLPPIDVRSVLRRVALPAFVAAVAVLGVVVIGGHIHAIADAMRRIVGLSAGWAAAGIAFECLSLGGYVLLLSLVAGRAAPRINARVSAQITFAGAAATRLLPTAGAGGAALALWTLRRAGLRSSAAARTLLSFLVLLYAVFLTAIVLSGAALTFGLVSQHGPAALSAIPAALAIVAFALALGLAFVRPEASMTGSSVRGRIASAAQTVGGGVRDACRLVRSTDVRLAGAIAYWVFDAAVLWAMLHAFGAAPLLPVVAIAYFVGQAANTVPIPGSVSGGIAAVLIAFGLPAAIALPAVLAYRTVSVWLPTPVAVAALPGLRSTIACWGREDSSPDAAVGTKAAV